MIDDVRAHLILTSSRYFLLASEFAGDECHVFNIDELDPSLSTEDLGRSISADAIACIVYTSGSTGQPNGVVHTHRKLAVPSHVQS